MHSLSFVLAFAICAVIFIYMGISHCRAGNEFSGDTEEVEARVTAIKKSEAMSKTMYNVTTTYSVFAEYNIGGRTVSGHHYSSLVGNMIDFSEGDTIRVTVSKARPEVFRLPECKAESMNSRGLMCAIIGGVFGVLALVILLVT